ncbi:hypothetical protein ACB098_06G035800 [Castanea mollissima]
MTILYSIIESEKNENLGNEPNSVKLKYVKLGYHYLVSNAIYIFLVPLTIASTHLSVDDFVHLFNYFKINPLSFTLCTVLTVFLATLHFMRRPKQVYLLNFSCYKPEPGLMCSLEAFMKRSERSRSFSEESLAFQKKILEKSGYGPKTYASKSLLDVPMNLTIEEARKEAEMQKPRVNVKDIGILIVNCSVFNPTPSLSAMVVNRYQLRENILSYDLGGMGCSAGLISIDLAKRLLQVQPSSYALVVSMESMTLNWYSGNNRSMLITNCLFRADDQCYNCVIQKEDIEKRHGISISKDLLTVAGEALKSNITTLGPLALPLSEQILFFVNLVGRKIFKMKIKKYVPDFKAVLSEVEKNLRLSEWHMEPSRMTLYRFGNTSSCSSLWYELAYSEAKGRIKEGNRVWQIAFGSGFKCNSVVWQALRTINPKYEKNNPWMDEIDDFSVYVPEEAAIVTSQTCTLEFRV